MRRFGIAITIYSALLALCGMAQDTDTIFFAAKTAMAKEWTDPTPYPDVDSLTGQATNQAGFVHCLEALDLYTRTGPEDPQLDATLALSKLISGNPGAARIYAEAQRLIGPDGMTSLLATAVTSPIDKTDKDKVKAAFAAAGAAILVAFQNNPERIGRDVNRWFPNDPPRALYGLLKDIAADKAEYDRVQAMIVSVSAAVTAAGTALTDANAAAAAADTALNDANNAASAAKTALDDAKNAADAAKTALSDANAAAKTADTALTAAKNAQKAAIERAKHTKRGEGAGPAPAAKNNADENVKDAQTVKDKADDDVTSANTAKAQADADVTKANTAKTSADTSAIKAATAKTSAEDNVGKATHARDDAQGTLDGLKAQAGILAALLRVEKANPPAAIDLMELYRNCYALDSHRLFKSVHDYFKFAGP